ncbi:hypothetical protein Bca101_026162 [Brassica carinata]
MDKKELASRSKEGRAKTEREILETLDHPFLPTLYAAIDSLKWLCLLTEFSPGGEDGGSILEQQTLNSIKHAIFLSED